MPTYVYECGKCGEEWEEVHVIADRNNCGRCGVCDGEGKKIITGFSNHVFRSRWMEGISSEPVYIESHKQLNSLCKENNCYIEKDDRRKQKAYYESRGMVEEGKRLFKGG